MVKTRRRKQDEKVGLLGDFQEIDSPTYLERLAQNIKLEGYFGKVSFYKVEEDSKPYESI